MPTRPDSPDPSRPGSAPDDPPAPNPFGGLGAGLGFFQDWMKAATSALPNLGATATPGASAWAMPTLDPQELDKRIQELKTVQFWLEQNARMLGMTIQTLEVQRMTLQTLKGMKVPMEALRESLQARATPQPAAPEEPAAPEPSAAAVNPLQWWTTLTEQFSNLASQAVQAGQEAMSTRAAPSPAPMAADTTAGPASPRTARRRAPARKSTRAKAPPKA